MKKILILFFCLLPIVFAQPVWAASDQEAEQIRKMIQQSIDKRSTLMGQQGHNGMLEWDGEMSVAPSGDYYSVRLPHMRMRYADKSFLDVGVVAMNVALDKDGMLRGSISMPTPITFYDAGGAAAFEISIGSQKLSGIWDPQTDIFKTMDSAYKDIKITSPDGKFAGQIGEIKAVADLKSNPDGTLSGPTDALFKDININLQTPQEGLSAKIDKLVVKSGVEKLDLQKMRDFQKNMLDKAARLQDSTASEEEKKKLASEVSNEFFDYISRVSDGFSSDFAATGISLSTQTAKNKIQFSLQSGGTKMSVSGLQGNNTDGRVTMSLIGLESTSFPAAYADLIPREINTDIHITRLPFQKLVATLHETTTKAMQAQAQSAELQQQQAMQQMSAMLPMILGEAGATLNITNTYLRSPLSETRIEGSAVANASSALGGTGTFLLSVTGLDAVMQKLQEMQKLPEYAGNKPLTQAMLSLAMVQMMGQQSTDATGKPVRSFKFEITADGQTLMNGAPMVGFGGGATGGAVPQQQPQPKSP